MSDSHDWFDVYYSSDLTKKHKNWVSGFLRWNTSNSQATLFEEDKKSRIGDSFINGGPSVGARYTIGGHFVELNTDAAPSAAVVSAPTVRGRVLHRPAKPAALAYKKPDPPVYAPTQPSMDHLNSSKSPSSTPPSSSNIRKRPFAQLPFRAPARSEPVVEISYQEEPQIEYSRPTPNAFSAPRPPSFSAPPVPAPAPTPAAPSTYYPMLDWNLFEADAVFPAEENAPAHQPDPVPTETAFGSDTFLAAEDPRGTPSNSTGATPMTGQQATSAVPLSETDVFQLHTRTHRVETSRPKSFETSGNSINLSTVVPKRAPPPLPPRAEGYVVSATPTPNQRLAAASPFAVAPRALAPPTPSAPKAPSSVPKVALAPTSQAKPFKTPATTSAPSSFSKAAPTPAAPANTSKFKAPAIHNPHEELLGFGTKTLVFPSRQTIARLPKAPRRAVAVTPAFNSIQDYKQQFTEALMEEINHGILPVATRFHQTYSRHAHDSKKPSESAKSSISSSFRSVYYDCQLINYKFKAKKRGRTGEDIVPNVSAQLPPMYLKISQDLLGRDSGASFMKDDLWIISSCADFEPQNSTELFFFARSAMHGKPSSVFEIKPIFDGAFKSMAKTFPNVDGEVTVHAIHALSLSTDMSMIEAVHDISVQGMPLLPYLLNRHPSFAQKPTLRAALPSSFIQTSLKNYLDTYRLNEDQFSVFKRAALWFDGKFQKSETTTPFVLAHGVFGSGKSFMLVALVMFICELFEEMEKRMPAVETAPNVQPHKFRILISAMTNTAVDRILVSLLDEGFTDFVRVGSLKRINSRILPYSIHREKRSGGGAAPNSDAFEESSAHSTRDRGARAKSNDAVDRIALRDLEELLRSKNITTVERALIEQQKLEIESGSFERKLELIESASVVGATCISTTFPILTNAKFDIVILDECSQMAEPLSLLPTSRFGSVGMVFVGDPLQLSPQLRTKPKNDDADTEGLGLALFSRLSMLGTGVEPILLRTQYRLHPLLSSIPNELFYHKKLINGTNSLDRAPLHSALPTILFVDNEQSVERTVAGGSIENPMEADMVIIFLKKLVSTYGIEGERIGVICLYKAQANLINKILESQASNGSDFADELGAVQISTVDAFQGAEKDVILLSTCRTENEGSSYSHGAGGFLESPYRLNVSVTRGKRHMFILGCAPLLLSSNKWKVVLNTARGCGPRSYISGHSILTGDYFKN